MNPSTDSDNFEKANSMKEKMSEANGNMMNGSDRIGEDVVQRYQTSDFEEYDEVFVDMEETESTTAYSATYSRSTRASRVRRTSDVIDSVGDNPSYLTKEKSHSFSSYDAVVNRLHDYNIPVRGRPIPTMLDGPMTPPMTPGSDFGYGSTGMPTPPSNAVYRPKTFRFSASSGDIAASPPRWDTQLDAKPIGEEDQTTLSNISDWTTKQAFMPVKREDRSYNMSHKRRGRAVIFNHEDFRDMSPRKGSGVDVTRLTSALQSLGFIVDIYNDLEIEKLKVKIGELSSEDHTDADCLIVTVLTHGLSTGCLMAKDYAYPIEHLWTPFAADKCPSLAGKPKLFFIQACRGEKVDGGVRLVRQQTETDHHVSSYKIPTMADFLLAFSTFEGHYSWRHPETGTWFVQCLCQVLEEEGHKSSLQDVLLEVSRRVAVDYESYNDVYNWLHEQKQVPQINSTLLRQVFFLPKD